VVFFGLCLSMSRALLRPAAGNSLGSEPNPRRVKSRLLHHFRQTTAQTHAAMDIEEWTQPTVDPEVRAYVSSLVTAVSLTRRLSISVY
jgi:hypothetical protein